MELGPNAAIVIVVVFGLVAISVCFGIAMWLEAKTEQEAPRG